MDEKTRLEELLSDLILKNKSDALTTIELSEKLGCERTLILSELRKLMKADKLEVCWVIRKGITGRFYRSPAYRLKTK